MPKIPDWRFQVRTVIEKTRAEKGYLRIALVGVGNELSADDAAGVLIARRIQSHLKKNTDRLILDAGVAPENVTGILEKFSPNLVLLIDAAQMNEIPGTSLFISPEGLDGISSFTHTLPLNVIAEYLKEQIHCDVYLLGIQPKVIEFDQSVSQEISKTIDEVITHLSIILAE